MNQELGVFTPLDHARDLESAEKGKRPDRLSDPASETATVGGPAEGSSG